MFLWSWGRALGRMGQVQVAGGVRKRRQGCPHPLLLVPRLAEQGSLCPSAGAVLAPAACRAIWEHSRTALEISLALHCNGTARWSCGNKNPRHTSPEVMLDSETWGCEGNDRAGPKTWLFRVCSLISSGFIWNEELLLSISGCQAWALVALIMSWLCRVWSVCVGCCFHLLESFFLLIFLLVGTTASLLGKMNSDVTFHRQLLQPQAFPVCLFCALCWPLRNKLIF